jgi:hypothetical protein
MTRKLLVSLAACALALVVPAPLAMAQTTDGATAKNECPTAPSNADYSGNGANVHGAYDNTCEPEHEPGNGNDDANATGQPCAGCVGAADNKNPPGQYPDGTDSNAGYECDRNQGVGQENPAHTGCATAPETSGEIRTTPTLSTTPTTPGAETITAPTPPGPAVSGESVTPPAELSPQVLGESIVAPSAAGVSPAAAAAAARAAGTTPQPAPTAVLGSQLARTGMPVAPLLVAGLLLLAGGALLRRAGAATA